MRKRESYQSYGVGKKLTKNDWFWVIGFLEGEGSFGKCGNTVVVTASQVTIFTIQKLHTLLGGGINQFTRKEIKGNGENKASGIQSCK